VGLQFAQLYGRFFALVVYALFGTIIIKVIIMIINNNNNNNEYNIKISIMLVFMRGGSRVSAASIFQWVYCFKVVIKVKDSSFLLN